MKALINHILKSETPILSTHHHCDGDGLGSQMAMYHALKKIGKKPTLINPDASPRKYHFLGTEHLIVNYESRSRHPLVGDLCLLFDSNDVRLLGPMKKALDLANIDILCIDHHPTLSEAPQLNPHSWIDTDCASTGEMTFELIQTLGIPLDQDIATCLYTSICFDTQLFRYVKASPRSHEIAAQLLRFPIHPEKVHQNLFGLHSLTKMRFLADIMKRVEIYNDGKAAFLAITAQELENQGLEVDDSRDVIDLLMNIEGVQLSCLIREDLKNLYKLSFRSKGSIEVLEIARELGGGGHKFAAGASTEESTESVRKLFIQYAKKKLNE